MNFELPLFPLNTVLFPGMPLQLHIFEDRYKLMIEYCLQENHSFGVVLIDAGQEALGPLAKPHQTGCLAQIAQVEKLDQGRLNISSFGTERFKILHILQESPYLTAEVEKFPLVTLESERTRQASDRLLPFLEQYLSLLAVVSDIELDFSQIPDNPVELAYISSYLVQTSNEQKQILLEMERTYELLDQLRVVYRREIALMRVMAADIDDSQADSISFSQN